MEMAGDGDEVKVLVASWTGRDLQQIYPDMAGVTEGMRSFPWITGATVNEAI